MASDFWHFSDLSKPLEADVDRKGKRRVLAEELDDYEATSASDFEEENVDIEDYDSSHDSE